MRSRCAASRTLPSKTSPWPTITRATSQARICSTDAASAKTLEVPLAKKDDPDATLEELPKPRLPKGEDKKPDSSD